MRLRRGTCGRSALFGPAVVLAAFAAVAGGPRRAGAWRPTAAALVATALLLGAVVALRPPSGLPAQASGPAGPLGTLAPGLIELDGPRLRGLTAVRKWTFRWDGPLRAPASGTYRLWAAGRGRVEVDLDGARVLEGEGETLRAGADVPIGVGAHDLSVTLTRTGPGPRLRARLDSAGWTRRDDPHAGPGTASRERVVARHRRAVAARGRSGGRARDRRALGRATRRRRRRAVHGRRSARSRSPGTPRSSSS